MKERQNTLQYKRQDTIESLSIEVASLGIFDALSVNTIRKLIKTIVEKQPIDIRYNDLKSEAIQLMMELNKRNKLKKRTIWCQNY
ncbi:hypothetical protein ACT7DN_19875 [Bacillus paranthracis]